MMEFFWAEEKAMARKTYQIPYMIYGWNFQTKVIGRVAALRFLHVDGVFALRMQWYVFLVFDVCTLWILWQIYVNGDDDGFRDNDDGRGGSGEDYVMVVGRRG